MRSARFTRPALLLAGTSTLAFAFTAQAQTAAKEEVLQEIVVTGSRVITNGNDSPSPVTIVQTEELLKAAPGNLAEALVSMPAFAGSRGTTSSPAVQGSQGGGNPSANQLTLRNLGVLRTLVLMDGYRIPPTSFNNVVDVDLIPQMLVQRVDVVTGGVSAVYGSDAVAGVVNYILNKKFNGLRVEGSAGTSEHGGADKWDIGIAAGTELFGGRGHIEGSYQHLDNNGIQAKSERPWIWEKGWGVAGNGTAAAPYTLRNDIRMGQYTSGGVITTGTFANRQFTPDKVLVPYVAGTIYPGVTGQELGGDGGVYDPTLMASSRQDQVFVRYDHDLTDNLHGYLQVAGEMKQDTLYGDSFKERVQLSGTNPFLPAQYQSAGTFRFQQVMDNFSRYHSIMDSSQWVYTAGLEGSMGDFKWGLNYTHGTSILDNHMENSLNYQRLYASVDAVSSGGNIVCAASLIANSGFQDCVPINLFGGAPSAAAMAYIMPATDWRGTTTQDNVAANISGSLFNSWAGPVNMALSGEWRKLSFEERSTADALATVDCTYLRSTATGQANCALATGSTTRGSQSLWKYPFPATDTLSQSVKEAALEADVPLVKDAPGIQSLNINGAVRYTSYSLSGDYTTWKIGLDWKVIDQLRFRATASQDIRAPSLYELYVPASATPVNVTDRLTLQAPTVPSRDLGDVNLKAEAGKTLTGGVVFNATPDLSFALDGYQIKINDAIGQVVGSAPSNQDSCYADPVTFADLCKLQGRPLNSGSAYNPEAYRRSNGGATTAASNAWTAVFTQYKNLSSIETYGADLEINFKMRIADRPLTFRLLTAYQPHSIYLSPGSKIDQGGVAFGPTSFYAGATLRLTAFVHAELTDAFSIDLMERYRNAMKVDGDESYTLPGSTLTEPQWVNNHIDSFATTNLTLTYKLLFMEQANTEIYFNVSNLFDAKAPGGSFTTNGGRPGLRDGFVPGDDVVGRAYTLGFKLKM